MKIVCSSVRGDITRSAGVKSQGGRPATKEIPTRQESGAPQMSLSPNLIHDFCVLLKIVPVVTG